MTNKDLHPLTEKLITAPYTQYQAYSDLHVKTVNQIILDYLEGVMERKRFNEKETREN